MLIINIIIVSAQMSYGYSVSCQIGETIIFRPRKYGMPIFKQHSHFNEVTDVPFNNGPMNQIDIYWEWTWRRTLHYRYALKYVNQLEI